jgi:hypothetical protein
MEQSRRASMAGTLYAVGGALWFGIATLVAARFGGDPPPASGAFYLSEAVWVVVQLLLLVGIAVIRARRWQGWARFTPLLAGLYFFLVMLPFVIVADAPNLFAVGGWGLLRLALGLAIRMQGQAVNTRLPSNLPLQQG